MGGGSDNDYDPTRYGSVGGMAMSNEPMNRFDVPPVGERKLDRRSSEDVPYDEDIEMRMRVRVMNDILHGLIKPDELNRLPNMKSSDQSTKYLPPMGYNALGRIIG